MKKPKLSHSSVIIISGIIIVTSLIFSSYLQEPIQAGTCANEGISNIVYQNKQLLQAACGPERSNDTFFHTSGGSLVGIFALGMFWLSINRGWRIGMLSALPVASIQFIEVYLENFRGYLYSNSTILVPVILAIIAILVFVVIMDKFSTYQTSTKRNTHLPVISLIITGTIISSYVVSFLQPENIGLWIPGIVFLGAGFVFKITTDYVRILSKKS